MCTYAGICCYTSVCYFISLPHSFWLFFLSLTVHTYHADYDVCTAGLDRAVQEKPVVYGSPVDILIWLSFHFSGTWNFNCAGVIDSACLTMVEKPLKKCCILTEWMDTPHATRSSIKKSWFLTTHAMVPHLLTTFLYEGTFDSFVPLKCYSTPRFYGNNNILVVTLQAGV